jgi:glucokinase
MSQALVADIGGTNTRVALATGAVIDRASIRRFANSGHSGLGEVLTRFLADAGKPVIDGACVAVAGPVDNGVANMTNLDWCIDCAGVTEATGAARVAVLNDLQAQGHGLDALDPAQLRKVIARPPTDRANASRLVIGVGTGFNAAPVHIAPGGRLVVPSECGHVTLPVRNDGDLALMRYVEKAHGFAGVEDVLSGRGLERLYAFHAMEAGIETHLKAAEIMAAMEQGTDAVVLKTGRDFVRLLGAVAGDLALIHVPYAGIHLIGGVARAFTPYFERYGFAEAFCDKGRFAEFMQEFSVSIVEDDYLALTGCAIFLADGLAG